MSVRKFLDISTANVRPRTLKLIEDGVTSCNTLVGSYGVFVYVPSEPRTSRFGTEDLEAVFELARQNDCDYVMFDADADIHPKLPDYSDEWEPA